MKLSYWDTKSKELRYDLIIIGGGFTGLNAAISFKKSNPDSAVLIIEKHINTRVASTRNAGFLCFGSLTEILSDVKSMGKARTLELVRVRYEGIESIKERFTSDDLELNNDGGYELIDKNEMTLSELQVQIEIINKFLYSIFQNDVFSLEASNTNVDFGLSEQFYLINNKYESGLNPAKLVRLLTKECYKLGVHIQTGISVLDIEDKDAAVVLTTSANDYEALNVIMATNGLASDLLKDKIDIRPARNIVLVSEPIPNLKLKGVFHMVEGYIYFRNVDNRLLIGGGRHWDLEKEFEKEFGWNVKIESKLLEIVKNVILPNQEIPTFEYRWSGIMGVGDEKKPIISKISKRIYLAARLGGMGVALSSKTGKLVAEMLTNDLK